ncbi:MAG: ParA family protein [Treponema sp.]|nr:ParA family protein [Candidatus Treponema caballi]
MKTQTITTVSTKGGTGKTTVNTLIAETLAAEGKRVLLIDLDPNLTMTQTFNLVMANNTSKDLISGITVQPYSITNKLDFIPADLDLSFLANIMDTQLKNCLQKGGYIGNYDYIIIDPPGHWCSLSRNAIFACQKMIVTGNCSKIDFYATSKFMQTLQNCCLDVDLSVVVNQFKTKLNEPEALEMYQNAFADYLYKEPIPQCVTLKKITSQPDLILPARIKNKLIDFVHEMSITEEAE